VKHWQETAIILGRLARLADAGRRAALATVVQIEGSAYRRPGAKFLVEDDGATRGSVSGGCLEADVRETALSLLASEAPRLLHYDTGSDDRTPWGLGLGCNGTVDVFVQAATTAAAAAAFERVRALLRGDDAFAVSTVLTGAAAGKVTVHEPGAAEARGASGVQEVDGEKVFTEALLPPPHLLLFGAGDDAVPLARFAAEVGFRVTVVDHRPAYLVEERYPAEAHLVRRRPEEGLDGLPVGADAFAVLKAHGLATDREWLRRLLPTPVRYLGLLGPRTRTEELLRQIEAPSDPRIFAPVGLDLGAEGPEQVALSIVAELLAAGSGVEPRHLRTKAREIHAR